MKFLLLALAVLATASPHALTKRKDCDNHGCVLFYSDDMCTDGLERGSYAPDCTG
jgi:hypothetical protein